MTTLPLSQAIGDDIAALLLALDHQLDRASDKTLTAYEYIDLDHHYSALGTLAHIEDQINHATALYNAILTLYRLGRERAENPLNLPTP